MVDITPRIAEGMKIISSYGQQRFIINNVEFRSSVIVLPEEVISWELEDITKISKENISQLLFRLSDIEIVLIGTGVTYEPLLAEVKKLFKDKQVAVEVMDTGAACRTFNVLQSEGRKVAAALINV